MRESLPPTRRASFSYSIGIEDIFEEQLQKESIAQILQAGWYLMELINEILDLAMIASGRLSWSIEPMALTEVMLECQTMIEPLA